MNDKQTRIEELLDELTELEERGIVDPVRYNSTSNARWVYVKTLLAELTKE